MNDIVTNLTTVATFSEDGSKRYLLRKTWDTSRPRMAIIMLMPSEATGIALDYTTMLVLNNAVRLGFGGVDIVNLFSTLNDFTLRKTEDQDVENQDVILQTLQAVDTIVYAPGLGKSKNKIFQKRQLQILELLRPFESKLHCLCNAKGKGRFQHPLSPTVREWRLSPMKIEELTSAPSLSLTTEEAPQQPQRSSRKSKPTKK